MLKNYIKSLNKNLKYWIISFFVLFFAGGILFVDAGDLLSQLTDPARHSSIMIDLWETKASVWSKFFKWRWGKPSTVIKIIRMLLVLTIALSVTMILYNWMMYIIETWQWKEWKSLKNVAYIVVWILLALFSVIIIRLIQSIPTTLEKEMPESTYTLDESAVSQ